MPDGTGDCFQQALYYAAFELPRAEWPNYRVVHGYPTGQGPIAGIVHVHAWVERMGEPPPGLPPGFGPEVFIICIDRSNGKDLELPRVAYYAFGKIDPEQCHYYEVAEASRLACETGHFGPWHTPL